LRSISDRLSSIIRNKLPHTFLLTQQLIHEHQLPSLDLAKSILQILLSRNYQAAPHIDSLDVGLGENASDDLLSAAFWIEDHQSSCCEPLSTCTKIWSFFFSQYHIHVPLQSGIFILFNSSFAQHGTVSDKERKGCQSICWRGASQIKQNIVWRTKVAQHNSCLNSQTV